jgi:molybdopterin molybdotransferase
VFSSPGKTTILPVNIEKIENENFCSIVKGKSGMITTVGKSDGFIILDENSEGLLKDTLVEVYLFR